MSAPTPKLPATHKPAQNAVNPFARALAETEQSFNQPNQPTGTNSLFSDALSKTGGAFDFGQAGDNQPNPENFAEQQRKMEAERKKQLLRKKLHDQVNPVDQVDLFNAREKRVKEQIDQLRNELTFLVKDVAKFKKDVEVTLMTEVGQPGQDGKYYISFFQQLRSFIMLLRQKVKSASTWATQLQSKKRKRAKKGLMIGGNSSEKTSTIQDMMHHERSTQFSGG